MLAEFQTWWISTQVSGKPLRALIITLKVHKIFEKTFFVLDWKYGIVKAVHEKAALRGPQQEM